MSEPIGLNAFDVIVVGGGAAGLYAALCLPSHYQVGLITKESLSLSASDWAQGGIAAAIASDDSPELHIQDTLKAGAGLCDRDAVQVLVERAPECIRNLVDMGVAFDQHGGTLAMTLEAAHSRRRVLHAADTTGRAVVTVLAEQVLARPNIRVIQSIVLDLWMREDGQSCQGVVLAYDNQIQWLPAAAVILATGGGGHVFSQTTNPALSTGDGVAMAWRVGATLRDLEFFQFHPTALTKLGAPRFLISEAVRGEGAHLIDAKGDRFTFEYHPDGELAPRDIVSRAIYTHLQTHYAHDPDAHVWLDMRPIDPATAQHRFPNIIQVCQRWGIDVFKEPIPVAPAAHYWMGGVLTDTASRTTISNLYAVGETASTGVHGANRLASNSLLECIVFGAAFRTLELPESPALSSFDQSFLSSPGSLSDSFSQDEVSWKAQQHWALSRREALAQLMWQSAGICRDRPSILGAIEQVQVWQAEARQWPMSHILAKPAIAQQTLEMPYSVSHIRPWSETRNLLDVAYLILNSALFREESRGGHYRSDYPNTQPSWKVHTLVKHQQWWKSPTVVDSATV